MKEINIYTIKQYLIFIRSHNLLQNKYSITLTLLLFLLRKNLVFLDMLLEKNVFQSKPFQKMYLYIFLKMKKCSNTVLLNTNTNAVLEDLLEKLDSSNYF